MGDFRKTREWQAVAKRVLARDGYTCRIRADGCTVNAKHVDHIIPVNEGGPKWDLANLRAACAHCNCGRPQRNRGANLRKLRYRNTVARYETRM